MTKEENKDWAGAYAELILSAVERELGCLPPPPSKREFHRLWKKHVTKKLYAKGAPFSKVL